MTRERLSDDYKRQRLADLFGMDAVRFRFMGGTTATRCYTALKTSMLHGWIAVKSGGVKHAGVSIIDNGALDYTKLLRIPNLAEKSVVPLARALGIRIPGEPFIHTKPRDTIPIRPKIKDFDRPMKAEPYRHITIVKCRNETGVRLRYSVLAATSAEAFQEAWRAYRDLKYMDDEAPPKWFKAKIVEHQFVQRVAAR